MKTLIQGLLLAAAFLLSDFTAVAAEATNAVSSVAARIERAQGRIKEIEVSKDLDDAAKAKLLESYRGVVSRLESAVQSAGQVDFFSRAITNAPAKAKVLRQRVKDGDAGAEIAAFANPPANATAEQLGNLLTQARAVLTEWRGRQAELTKLLSETAERPNAIRAELTQVRALIEQIRADLNSPAPTADATEPARVGRQLLEARGEMRGNELRSLEQELLSHSARQDLYSAEQDLVALQVARLEDAVRQLEADVSKQRLEEARAARVGAARLQNEAKDKHRLIASAAETAAKLSLEIEPLLPEIDSARSRRQKLEKQLEQIRADHAEARKSIDLGVSESVGAILFEQRRRLPDARAFRSAFGERHGRTGELRLQLFRLEREMQAMADIPGLARELIAREQAPKDVRPELEEALKSQRDNLDRLAGVIRDYLAELGSEEAVERDLISEARSFAHLLDSNLLWIRSAAPMNANTLRRLPSDASLLLRPANWTGTLQSLRADFLRNTFFYLFALGFICWLLWNRKRWGEQFAALAEPIGKVGSDRFSNSAQAFAIHVGRSLALAAAGSFIGWRLVVAGESTAFSKAVGHGLSDAALLLFIGQLIRGIFRMDGLATAHFCWSESAGLIVRRSLAWFIGVAVPLAFIAGFAQHSQDTLTRHSVGRAAFILLMLATAALGYRLFNLRQGLTSSWAALGGGDWRRHSRPLLLLLAVGLPALLAGLAWSGYFYTSLQFLLRLNLTVGLGLLIVFIHAFFTRWLLISERRLALKMALEKRAARQEEHGDEDEELKAETLREISSEIDVHTIGEQTRELLRISLGLVLVLGLLFVWVGVLPALKGLGSYQLWDTKSIVDGQEKLAPVTLAHLGMALLILGATVAGARNLPGFLEIALLQRLPMDPGTRYAVKALVLYGIVGAGLLYSCGAIGMSWSSVQWLVAALTVGLGFGLQEIFANFVSGIIILLERPIRVGDTVTVGSVSGVVSRIRMRATTITDWTRKELVVPNKNFITGELINWSLSDPILRLEFPVGIAYGSNTVLAHKIMLETAKAHPLVLEQPEPTVFFTGFGDNSLNFEIRVFVAETTNTARTRIIHDLHMAIDQACRKEKVEIAFPQRDLHLRSAPAVIRVEHINRKADGSTEHPD